MPKEPYEKVWLAAVSRQVDWSLVAGQAKQDGVPCMESPLYRQRLQPYSDAIRWAK